MCTSGEHDIMKLSLRNLIHTVQITKIINQLVSPNNKTLKLFTCNNAWHDTGGRRQTCLCQNKQLIMEAQALEEKKNVKTLILMDVQKKKKEQID